MKTIAQAIVLMMFISGLTFSTSFANPFPGQRIKVRVGGKMKKMTKITSYYSLRFNILHDVNQIVPKKKKDRSYKIRKRSRPRYR